jgi:hypothetical protein
MPIAHALAHFAEPIGKTAEFRNQNRSDINDGIYSFFIRLDLLVAQPIGLLLGPADHKQYQEWQQGTKMARFFLDSVDEAKFHRLSDFYAALDKFHDIVGGDALTRAQIFLSCRISEWQPESDRTELLERFPEPPPLHIQSDNSENVSLDNAERPQPLLVVRLLPLDRKRVEKFAKAREMPNVEDFIKALDVNHAWEFARRPVDVVDLGNFWSERGRLGSLTEMIEFSTDTNLRPRSRGQSDPLSPKEARIGAEALAAAVIFLSPIQFSSPG